MNPRYENTDGPSPEASLANELELELHLQRVTLRDFDYRLMPLRPVEEGPAEGVFMLAERGPLDGLELEAIARDTGLKVSLRFDRGEFVNIATAGLSMLDAGDAIE